MVDRYALERGRLADLCNKRDKRRKNKNRDDQAADITIDSPEGASSWCKVCGWKDDEKVALATCSGIGAAIEAAKEYAKDDQFKRIRVEVAS